LIKDAAAPGSEHPFQGAFVARGSGTAFRSAGTRASIARSAAGWARPPAALIPILDRLLRGAETGAKGGMPQMVDGGPAVTLHNPIRTAKVVLSHLD